VGKAAVFDDCVELITVVMLLPSAFASVEVQILPLVLNERNVLSVCCSETEVGVEGVRISPPDGFATLGSEVWGCKKTKNLRVPPVIAPKKGKFLNLHWIELRF
jgi:hypothetical protein